MEKRGLSGVITIVIMIALVMVLASILWVVINNLVSENLGGVERCTDIFDQVEINKFYTCYSSTEDILQFSISLKNVELDGLRVSISSGGSGKSFVLTPEGVEELDTPGILTGYNQSEVVLPGRNSGLTYNYSLSTPPDILSISPILNENQCGETDRVLEFPSCSAIV